MGGWILMVDVKDKKLPGAALKYGGKGEKGFAQFQMLISATKGLSLSQVCAMTGLEATTIQNWVKRGWVAHPNGKKYAEVHIARILIINALKECLKLEHISLLIGYVKGAQENVGAGSIKESDLYSALCEALFELESGKDGGGAESIAERIALSLENYTPKAKKRIQKALTVMIYACVCADVKRRTDSMMSQVLKEHGVMAPTVTKSAAKKQQKAERPALQPPENAKPEQRPEPPARTEPKESTEQNNTSEQNEQTAMFRKTVSQAIREWDAEATLENAQKSEGDAKKAFAEAIKPQSISETPDSRSDLPGITPERVETPIVKPIYFNKE
jgi:DNA-binding transcriptional MerR regulator